MILFGSKLMASRKNRAEPDQEDSIMIPKKQQIIKAVALFLAFSISQLYVQVSANAQDPATPAPQTFGKLFTSGNRDILVNKQEASTGATILDGALLETPDCVTATVRFGLLDEVNLATNTIAVINYSSGKINVTLKQGCARVRVQQSVNGIILTPDGKTTPATQPDDRNRQLAEVCYLASGIESDFHPNCKPFSVIYIGGIVGAIGGVIAFVAISSGSSVGAQNTSFSAPF